MSKNYINYINNQIIKLILVRDDFQAKALRFIEVCMYFVMFTNLLTHSYILSF